MGLLHREAETFIKSYRLLVDEGRIDLLTVRMTMLYSLYTRGLMYGFTEDTTEAALIISTFDDITYN